MVFLLLVCGGRFVLVYKAEDAYESNRKEEVNERRFLDGLFTRSEIKEV